MNQSACRPCAWVQVVTALLALNGAAACTQTPEPAPLADAGGLVGDITDPADGGGIIEIDAEVTARYDSYSDAAGLGCPALAPCDDGDPCTLGDRCLDGVCVGGLDLCVCRDASDCQALHPNRCEGSWTCDTSTPPHACRLIPGSVVVCDSTADTLCAQARCDPSTGTCGPTAATNGTACNDGNNCTVGDACKAGTCEPGDDSACACQQNSDCADDGDVCNGAPYCDTSQFPYSCKLNPATVVNCALPSLPCQVATCHAKTGNCTSAAAPDFTPCDDGQASTIGDACVEGQCVGADLGYCQSQADCEKAEDGDFCNGTLYCNLATKTCALNPATVVQCPTAADSTCAQTLCQPTTGACVLAPVNGGKPCDDGDVCTSGDHCQTGACVAGTDTCLCSSDLDCAAADDGNLCNGTLYCDKGKAKPRCVVNPATVKLCPSVEDTACLKSACVPLAGTCTMTAVEQTIIHCDPGTGVCRREQRPKGELGALPLCSDGEDCTVGDQCAAGACIPGTSVCVCKVDTDCAANANSNLCLGAWYCDKSGPTPTCKPNPSAAVVCPSGDDTDCLVATCEPATGTCKPKLVDSGTPCDDGDPCSVGTFCVLGECKGGQGACECQSHAECESKQGDGDLCNGVLYCDKTGAKPACKLNPASVVNCPPNTGSPCLSSVCNAATGLCGLKASNEGKVCDDGSVCSVGDLCSGGLCVGTKDTCDDKDPCTADACLPGQGCSHVKKLCDDGNACTADVCSAINGNCVADASGTDGKVCDADGTPCTEGDTCAAGVCKAGPKVQCAAPSNPCQTASCVALSASSYKCVAQAAADGQSCDGPGICALGSSCAAGVCVAGNGGARVWQRVAPLLSQVGVGDPGYGLIIPTGALPASGGGLVVASYTRPSYDVHPALHTFSTTGEHIADKHLSGQGMHWATPRRSALLPDGSLMLVGYQSLRPWWGKVAQNGTDFAVTGSLAETGEGGTGANIGFIDVSAAGSFVAMAGTVGTSATDPTLQAVVRQETTSGVALWTFRSPKTGGVAGGLRGATAVAQHPDGAVTAVAQLHAMGSTSYGTKRLLRLGADGKPLWQKALLGDDVGLYAGRLRLRAGGGFWLVGGRLEGGKLLDLVASLDADGELITHHSALQDALTYGAVVDGGGRLVSVGFGYVGAPARWRFTVRAPTGTTLAIEQGTVDNEVLYHVDLLPGGAIVALGTHRPKSPGLDVLLVQRRDAFGHLSCASAGACFAQTPVDCDDGDACTLDACDSDKGCTHSGIVACQKG